jgi:predicted transcriptional regulator
MANESHSTADEITLARIREGLAQAQRGDFVTDDEMEAFFARHTESSLS